MKKVIAAVAGMCLMLFAAGVGYTVGENGTDASVPETTTVAVTQETKTAEIQPAPLTEIKTDTVKATATPNGKCDICGDEVPETQLTSLNCGKHKACSTCAEAKGTEYSKHNDTLPCGAYECDGKDHYREPINCYCPNEPQHYACECENLTHHCSACGKDYTCEDSNCHAICAFCGKNWCTNESKHGFCTVCGGARCDGGDHDKCTVPGCPYYNCQEHYHCPFCNDLVECTSEHKCKFPGCDKYFCDGHTHFHHHNHDKGALLE